MLPVPGDVPLISVLLPVRNGAAYIEEAIGSLRAQTVHDIEIIVIDDGSTDATPAIVTRLVAADARIRLLSRPAEGVASALNAGLDVARGAWIARMDADDIAAPHRFERQLAWMQQHGVQVCGSLALCFGEQESLLWFPERDDAIRNELVFRVALLHPTILAEADVYRRHRYDAAWVHEDYEWYTRLAGEVRLGNVPEILLRHRRHPAQVCQSRTALMRADLDRARQPYVQRQFGATADDQRVLTLMVQRRPCRSLAELERAGQWLLTLATPPDRMLQRYMLQRWHACCFRSAHLGLRAYRLFSRLLPGFRTPLSARQRLHLLLACLLRTDGRTLQLGWAARGWRRLRRVVS